MALATGSALSRNQSGLAQDGPPTPLPTTEAALTTGNAQHIMVNVKDFGAVGDYATDDTAAIQSAINSLGPNGGVVYFPGGDYSVTSAITVNTSNELLGESLNARILARTSDAAVKVANPDIINSDIYIRRLNIRNDSATPIGVDARYMTGCVIENSEIDNFSQYGIFYGGNTNLTNGSWSNSIVGSVIRNSATCIYFNGMHSEGGSPANWMTIERCLIIPTNTTNSVGIDLVNGDTVRVINNDISYANSATGIVIRKHLSAQLEYNRFEDIGTVAPSHPIEKEFGYSNFQITGVSATIHYQRAEYMELTGGPTGGTFTLTRGTATTGTIAFSTNETTLADNVRIALESLEGVGAGNVTVTAVSATSTGIAWLNGRGRSNRPNLEAESNELTGGDTPAILVVQGSFADAIGQASDIALAGVVNDTESPAVSALGEHLDVGIPVVTRQSILAVNAPGSMGVRLQRNTEQFPRMELSVNGRIQWTNPETGQSVGGLNLVSSDPEDAKVGWDDNLNVELPRRTTDEGDASVGNSFRGSLHRYEGESGERDQLRVGVKDKDDTTYFRHLYAGFPASQNLDFPSIVTGGVAGLTMTATGAQIGDAVIVIPPPDLVPGLMSFGFVSSENTVTIRLFNGSGEERLPEAATWSILVLQP